MGMGNRGNSASSVKSTTDDDSDEDSPPPLLAGLKKRASSFMAGLDRSKSDRNVNSNSESAVSSIDEEEDKNDVQHFELVNQTDIEGYLKKYQFDEPDCNGTKMVGGEFLYSTKGKNLHSLPENDHMPPCEVEDF